MGTQPRTRHQERLPPLRSEVSRSRRWKMGAKELGVGRERRWDTEAGREEGKREVPTRRARGEWATARAQQGEREKGKHTTQTQETRTKNKISITPRVPYHPICGY